ncbi:MAG: helix-turn-helix transcriptional regulator [Halobellus sp.]|uniref:helix-turn-helix transcriptional regulator n=1 Tax=Halobellus sp. TaxID=1979212 RepID=UPI0035D40745
MSDYPAPDILDVVEAPSGTCEVWCSITGGMTICGAPADVLYVYDHYDDARPGNALACAEHGPDLPDGHEGLRTDGGQLEPSTRPVHTWSDLHAFQRDCLVAIAALAERVDPEPHGRAIQDRLREAYDEPIYHSRLYQNLDALVDPGLVAKTKLNGRTNGYLLTETGRATLQAGADRITEALSPEGEQ